MKRSDLVQLVREVLQELDEANTTNVGGASFTTKVSYAVLLPPVLVAVTV